MSITRRRFVRNSLGLGLGIAFCGCRSVPMTDRKQIVVLPESQEAAMGLSAFKEATDKQPASTNAQYIEIVNRVGKRLAEVANRPDYQWEYKVLASPEQNAFCLPGGKVAVYEGILPVCGNEAGVAVVMSHEISHALARHGGERMSHQYAVEGVKKALTWATDKTDEKQRELVMQAYGAGTKYGVLLPYSRKHELEADHMGILLMAKAGYDPAEAPQFWQRFAAMTSQDKPAEFLSTHPSDEKRAKALQDLLPEANGLYAATTTKFGSGQQLQIAQSSVPPSAGVVPASSFQPGLHPQFQPGLQPAGYSGAMPPAAPQWLPQLGWPQRG